MDDDKVIRIIGKNYDDFLLGTYHKTATLNDIFDKGFIVTEDGEILSPELSIGVFVKEGYWESVDYVLEEKNFLRK